MITYKPFGPKTQNWDGELLESIARECYIPAFEGPPWFEIGDWTVEGVVSDITSELSRDGAVGFVALDEEKVVGCIWGYPMEARELTKKLKIEAPSGGMYLDEICVSPKYHRQKIGSSLYKLWKKQVGSEVILARTMTNPPTVVYPWFLDMGYKVVARYQNDDKQRVLLMKSPQLIRLPNWMVR